jgi:hypothetical protein
VLLEHYAEPTLFMWTRGHTPGHCVVTTDCFSVVSTSNGHTVKLSNKSQHTYRLDASSRELSAMASGWRGRVSGRLMMMMIHTDKDLNEGFIVKEQCDVTFKTFL